MDMHTYRLPGYELHLLGELQKQQNSAQFCDTLLQTEGISVPTHSCVLAALSPFLSEKLSATPAPPSGQMRQLKLRAVKAQTLLKLVGLLYSGEMQVKGGREQEDVLAAAQQFGVKDLIKGRVGEPRREMEPLEKQLRSSVGGQRAMFRKLHEAHVQAQPDGMETCVSTGMQPVPLAEQAMDSLSVLSSPIRATSQEPAPSAAHGTDSSPPLSSTSETNPTLTPEVSNSPTAVSLSPNEASSGHTNRDTFESGSERPGETNRTSSEKRHVNVGMKRLDRMKPMVDAAQISVKQLKLRRRRTKGEVWEVVGMQDADDTMSARGSLTQVHSKNPGILHPAPTSSTNPLVHPSASDSAPSNRPAEPSSAAVPQAQGFMEESDEQIENLLEDIMTGLNILPNLKPESTDTVHPSGHSAAAPTQPNCPRLSCVPTDSVLVQQLHRRSPERHASVSPVERRDGARHQCASFSRIPNSLCPAGHPPSSLMDLHYPVLLKAPPLDEQDALARLPLSLFSLPSMDRFHLPLCHSPIEPLASLAQAPPFLNLTEQPSSVHGRHRLTERPAARRGPLGVAGQTNWRSSSQDSSQSLYLEHLKWQHLRGRPYDGKREGTRPKAEELNSKSHTISGALIHQVQDANDNPVAFKRSRKCPSDPVNAVGSFLTQKNCQVSDGTKSVMNLSFCSVRLSKDNVLAKQIEMSTGSFTSKCVVKPEPTSSAAEQLKGKIRCRRKRMNTCQTRVRTRGFLRETQERLNSTEGLSGPGAAVTKQVPLLKRKPSKRLKLDGPESSNSTPQKSSGRKDSPKEGLEKGRVAVQRRCNRRKRTRAAEVIPPRSREAEPSAKAENNEQMVTAGKCETPKWLVCLKRFKKRVRQLKTRKENPEWNESGTQVEHTQDSGKTQAEMDKDQRTQAEDTGGTDGSHLPSNVPYDQNHNDIVNKPPADDRRSQGEDAEETRGFAETQQPQTNPPEGSPRLSGVAEVRGSPRLHSEMSEEIRMPLEHNSNPEECAVSLSGAGGSSSKPEEEEEEEEMEEMEVDVVLYTPDRLRSECEVQPDCSDRTSEQDEDDNEIDVTGDEVEW